MTEQKERIWRGYTLEAQTYRTVELSSAGEKRRSCTMMTLASGTNSQMRLATNSQCSSYG